MMAIRGRIASRRSSREMSKEEASEEAPKTIHGGDLQKNTERGNEGPSINTRRATPGTRPGG